MYRAAVLSYRQCVSEPKCASCTTGGTIGRSTNSTTSTSPSANHISAIFDAVSEQVYSLPASSINPSQSTEEAEHQAAFLCAQSTASDTTSSQACPTPANSINTFHSVEYAAAQVTSIHSSLELASASITSDPVEVTANQVAAPCQLRTTTSFSPFGSASPTEIKHSQVFQPSLTL